MTITHEQAWQYWMDNYESPYTVEKAQAFYEQEKRYNFSRYCDEEECLQEIENAKRWQSYDGWELQVYATILTTADLNKHGIFGDWECVPEHACDRSVGLAEDNPDWDYKQYQYGVDNPNNPSSFLLRPFTVRVFYLKDSEYQIAIVFTDEHDREFIAISERSD